MTPYEDLVSNFYSYKYCYSDSPEPLSRNESGRFGALKFDSTHHFFRNACTKSGSLRFSVFRLLTDFLCLYNYEFWLSLCKIFRSSVILLLLLFSPYRPEILHRLWYFPIIWRCASRVPKIPMLEELDKKVRKTVRHLIWQSCRNGHDYNFLS